MTLNVLLFTLSLFAIVLVSASKTLDLPVVLPPFVDKGEKPSTAKKEWGSCLFYMENLGIVVFQKGKKPSAWAGVIESHPTKDNQKRHTFTFDDGDVQCPQYRNSSDSKNNKFVPQNFTLKVNIDTTYDVLAQQKDNTYFTLKAGKYHFTLKFESLMSRGWQLVDVATDGFKITGSKWLEGDLDIKSASAVATSVKDMQISAFNGYNYGCSQTKVALFNVEGKKDVAVGVFFGNMQFQPYNYWKDKDGTKARFSGNTADCVGTFTHGSFMGIIVALVLASVLLFGFLMLNSVQTVDRFDDPKQKQLLINAKD